MPFHEHSPGRRDDHGRLAACLDPGELAPLPLNDRGQPRHVPAVCHKHRLRHRRPLPGTYPPFRVTCDACSNATGLRNAQVPFEMVAPEQGRHIHC